MSGIQWREAKGEVGMQEAFPKPFCEGEVSVEAGVETRTIGSRKDLSSPWTTRVDYLINVCYSEGPPEEERIPELRDELDPLIGPFPSFTEARQAIPGVMEEMVKRLRGIADAIEKARQRMLTEDTGVEVS